MADRTADKELLLQLRQTSRMIETEWVLLPEESALINKTIGELGVRSKLGTSIVAIIRGEDVLPNPGPEVAFEAGDVVGTLGTPDQRAAFRRLANELGV
jgi:K+/H+ antiporter YhaU regulatory subunit KhtT